MKILVDKKNRSSIELKRRGSDNKPVIIISVRNTSEAVITTIPLSQQNIDKLIGGLVSLKDV